MKDPQLIEVQQKVALHLPDCTENGRAIFKAESGMFRVACDNTPRDIDALSKRLGKPPVKPRQPCKRFRPQLSHKPTFSWPDYVNEGDGQ